MLKDKYYQEIVPALLTELNLSNKLAVPRIEKIVVAMGVGKYKDNENYLKEGVEELSQITGQRPVSCRSRKAIAAFKLRKNEVVGLQVTLRGSRMWSFLDRLINVALPRVRDFHGVNGDGFDGHGNYSLGIVEHNVFPEVDSNRLKTTKGFQVSIITSGKVTDEEAKLLLTKLGMPFKKEK